MMDDPDVRDYVLSFLKTGAFTTPAERQPIPLAAAAQP
jgi:hypothetical protein